MQRLKITFAVMMLVSMAACNSNPNVVPGVRPQPDDGTEESSTSIETGKILPAWMEGEMDIHFINTTTGECTFIIFPDGTQMLIDAASSTVATNSNRNTTNAGIRSRWDPTLTSTRGSEIIADHIKQCMEWTGNNTLDYVVFTHFDNDHIGGYTSDLPLSSNSSGYRLNGASEILDLFDVSKLIDRGYPDYNYPIDLVNQASNRSCIKNYVEAVRWHVENEGLNAEIFKPGVSTQIVPKTGDFDVKVQNVAVNGEIWTGTGTSVTKTFPALSEITVADPSDIKGTDNCPFENICSCVMKISYGNFDFFAGGDLQYNSRSTYAWKDAELPCAKAVGQVELMKANHHGVTNTNQADALKYLDPQAIVVCSWVDCHPRTSVLDVMGKTLPEADIFITNFWKGTRPDGVDDQVTEEEAARVKGYDGHIIIRVTDGGMKYNVVTTTDSDGTMTVKSVSGPYSSR